MLRALDGYLAAVLAAYVAAAAAQTQSVMARLGDMDVDVGLGERLGGTAQDIAGMTTTYLPMIAIGFAIAFPVAAAVIRRVPRWRPVGYALAGGVAVLMIHVLLNWTLSITPVSAARSSLGLTVQALCGAFGGWVFLKTRPRPAPRART